MKAIIVGAGIIGCTLAHALVSRGHQVTLIEEHRVAGGTTATNYGWINSHKKHPDTYHAINSAGMRHWSSVLAERHPELVAFNGHVEIAVDNDHRTNLTRRLERLRTLDYEAHWISPEEARRLTPVMVPDDALTGWFPGEGHAYPAQLAETLMRELAAKPSFTPLFGKAVAISPSTASVTLASGGTVDGDIVVLCTGNGTTKLAATADAQVPLLPLNAGGASCGYLGYVHVQHHGLSRLTTMDKLSLRPDGPDDLIVQALDLDTTADPDSPITTDTRQEFTRRLQDLLPEHKIAVREIRVGQRVIPRDGLTIAGPVLTNGGAQPHLWVVATHSGVVLAPWLAEVIADEIDGEPPHSLLADFRPSRFQDPTPIDQAVYAAPRHPGDQ